MLKLSKISQDVNFTAPPGRVKGFSVKYKTLLHKENATGSNGERRQSDVQDKADSIERVRRSLRRRFLYFFFALGKGFILRLPGFCGNLINIYIYTFQMSLLSSHE